ncbi:hypothetical protein AHiyo8_38240 [Arthrobacter sp. Hiyo8]|nr:hypothetical protein AHiyo8_38240 [Arthrobacter sp. Hiyo8]
MIRQQVVSSLRTDSQVYATPLIFTTKTAPSKPMTAAATYSET